VLTLPRPPRRWSASSRRPECPPPPTTLASAALEHWLLLCGLADINEALATCVRVLAAQLPPARHPLACKGCLLPVLSLLPCLLTRLQPLTTFYRQEAAESMRERLWRFTQFFSGAEAKMAMKSTTALALVSSFAYLEITSEWASEWRLSWAILTAVLVMSASQLGNTILDGTFRLVGSLVGGTVALCAMQSSGGVPWIITLWTVPFFFATFVAQEVLTSFKLVGQYTLLSYGIVLYNWYPAVTPRRRG
jgi:Fusaric acid resistance protein-like